MKNENAKKKPGRILPEQVYRLWNNYPFLMEKVSRGLYIMDDVWLDELFILQQRNGAIIYSGETALYLHSLTDRGVFISFNGFGGF